MAKDKDGVVYTEEDGQVKAALVDNPEVCGYGPTEKDALKALQKNL